MALDTEPGSPPSFEDVEVHVGGGKPIRGLRLGRQGGDPWLFLHGWLDNAASFIPMLPLLHEKLGPDSELVAVDMTGHGHSYHRDSGYLLVDYAADALLIADSLGWARFSLVGHSLGGYASSLAAATQPERIVRLILLDITAPLGQEAEEAPASLAKSVAWVAERTTGAKAGGSTLKVFSSIEDAAKQRAAKNIGGPMTLANALLLASRGAIPAESSDGVVWASDPNLLQPSRQSLGADEAISFVRRIKCPTLVLLSADGIYHDFLRRGGRPEIFKGPRGIPITHVFGRLYGTYLLFLWMGMKVLSRLLSKLLPEKARALQKFAAKVLQGWRMGYGMRTIPSLRYEELKEGGHHFHMTCPEEAAQAISKWVKT